MVVWRPSEMQRELREGDVVLVSGLEPSTWQGRAEVRPHHLDLDLDLSIPDLNVDQDLDTDLGMGSDSHHACKLAVVGRRVPCDLLIYARIRI